MINTLIVTLWMETVMEIETMTTDTKPPSAEEREAFEEWAASEWINSNPPEAAWLGWQGCHHSMQGEVDRLRVELTSAHEAIKVLRDTLDNITGAFSSHQGNPYCSLWDMDDEHILDESKKALAKTERYK